MRFVVLQHVPAPESGRATHWDLLLDTGGAALRTWALAAAPRAGATIGATPLADHRRVFLVYEGPLTGSRGFVSRYDAGECEIVSESATRVELRMRGGRILGKLTLLLEPSPPSVA